MNVEVEIYMSNMIKFFKENPNDLINLIPKIKEEEFYFKGYDISKLENYYRCVTINKDRSFGTEGSRLHIFFNGATNECKELPKTADFESGVAKYEDWLK
jgi:hypothetical protein